LIEGKGYTSQAATSQYRLDNRAKNKDITRLFVIDRSSAEDSILANTAQARKRARQNTNRREANHSMRSMMRTYIKRVYKAIESNDKEGAQAAYSSAVSAIDKNAKRGLHHKNKAARLKSRMNTRIRAMS